MRYVAAAPGRARRDRPRPACSTQFAAPSAILTSNPPVSFLRAAFLARAQAVGFERLPAAAREREFDCKSFDKVFAL